MNVLKSDFLTTGPVVKDFEKSMADYVGAKYAVAIANGTAALHAACFAAGISKGDEVITTPIILLLPQTVCCTAARNRSLLILRGIPTILIRKISGVR